jgi:MipA family protein
MKKLDLSKLLILTGTLLTFGSSQEAFAKGYNPAIPTEGFSREETASSFRKLEVSPRSLGGAFPTPSESVLSAGCSVGTPGYNPTETSNSESIPTYRKEKNDWTISIGLGALLKPKYEGSDENEVMPVPFIDLRYKDLVSISPFGGLRLNAIKQGNITAGVGLRPNFGRKEDNADILNGLGNVDPTAEGLLFISYKYNSFSTTLTCAHDLINSGHEGLNARLSVSHFSRLPEYKMTIRPSISTTFANTKYMSSFFGINSTQSINSGLNVFQANSSFKDISANIMTSYKINEKWSLNGFFTFKKLIGDAADSPIVQKEDLFSLAIYAAYRF